MKTPWFSVPLTLDDFRALPQGEVFAKGIVLDGQPYFNLSGQPYEFCWVAVKGHADDWTVYVAPREMGFYYAQSSGDKPMTESYIRYLVPCTDEVFRRFRH